MFITFNQFKKALLAVKRYITVVMPKRTSDLLNDSGYITSAAFNINVTYNYNDDTYTADKTFQEISEAIASGMVPQVITNNDTIYKCTGQDSDEYVFENVSYMQRNNDQIYEFCNVLVVTNANSWHMYQTNVIIPNKVSDLTNDAGYLTSETDPTVPSWAKEATKPTYTAAEVGALPADTVMPADNVFIATYGSTTFEDTLAAYNADKLIFCVYNNGTLGKLILPLTRYSSNNYFQFESKYIVGRSERVILYLYKTNGWSSQSSYGDIVNRSAAIESGDSFIIRDANDSYVMKYSTLTFGTDTSTFLANNGTWQTPSYPVTSVNGSTGAVTISIPENVSDLTNDAGYLTSYTETDPTVPSWAKAETKPTYTASEVGAATSTHTHGNITNAGDITATATIANGDRLVINDESASKVTNSSITFGTGTTTFLANNGTWQTPSGAVTSVNGSTGAVNLTIPTKVSDLTNDSGFITDAGVTSFNGATGAVTYSAQYLINLTDTYDEDFDTHTYTADKTYQQITAAITEGKIPYVILGDKFYRYYGSNNGEHVFVDAVRYDNMDESIEMSSAMLSSNGTWMVGDFSVPVGQEQSDWAQNDTTANDYVKNRVCYTGDPVMTVITTGTMSANSSYIEYGGESLVKTDAIELLSIDDYPDLGGLEYSVVYGGTTYTGTIYSVGFDGLYLSIIGNPNIYDENYPDNGQPFVFNFYAFEVKEDAVPETDTAISISVPVSPVYKLDDKYLNGSLIKRGTGQYSVILNGEKSGLTASGDNSVAEGGMSTASGAYSHAEGSATSASTYASHAEGTYTSVTNDSGHAEGSFTNAAGYASHAEGSYTKTLGTNSHSEGYHTVASGAESHSEGYYTAASGGASHSEGGNSDNTVLSTTFGISLTGSANATTYTVTTTSLLESLIGFYISGKRVLSETYDGSGNVKTVTLEETLSTTAVSSKTYAIGKYGTSASGKNSHSEGFYSSATGFASHAEGFGTYANHRSQHVFGEWNRADGDKVTPNARGTYVEIVGNGTYNSKSNARTLDWNGNEVLAGKLTVGAAPTANMDVATKKYVDDAVAGSGSAVTYTLSITNNVITLTGSDGSTSSVTLPVYAGGVSS